MSEKIKIGIIDNSIDASVYKPIKHWQTYIKDEWHSYQATESRFPDLEKGYTHLILTGSESSILDRERWVLEEVELVKEAVRKGLPVLGSCFGHQLLALALCGPSSVKRSEHPEIGWYPIQIRHDNVLLGKKGHVYCFSSHFDEVTNLGKDFKILASSRYCPIQAFRMKERPVWGIQIHPEINVQDAISFLKRLISLGLPTSRYFEEALKQRPKDSGLIHRIIKSFLS